MNALRAGFSVSPEQCRALANGMKANMTAGLQGLPSDLEMLPSYVCDMPAGSEHGTYYALDLGGTNCRVLRVRLHEGQPADTQFKRFVISKELMSGQGQELFDFLATSIRSTILEMGDELAPAIPHRLGFTFSFPCDQTAINRGQLLHWTKGFTTAGVVGQEVVAMLQNALEKPDVGVRMSVEALVNDTVGTLMAKKVTEPACAVGVIFGTGTNASYVEKVSAITKLQDHPMPASGVMCVNMEWGNFGFRPETLALLPITNIDQELDDASPHPTRQHLEKLVGGLYLGELCGRWLNKLIEREEVSCRSKWGGRIADDAFTSECMSHIIELKGDMAGVKHVLEETLQCENVSEEDAKLVSELCSAVCERAALIGGSAVAGVLEHMRETSNGDGSKQRVVVGIDGSVFTKLKPFEKGLIEAIKMVVGEGYASCVELQASHDGSGFGAAVIAATASA